MRRDFHRFSRWHFVVLVFVAALLVAVLWPKESHSSATASRVARQSLLKAALSERVSGISGGNRDLSSGGVTGVGRGESFQARSESVVIGERYHGVTQANIATTICAHGFTATIRPPTGYTSALKKWLLKDRNLPGTVSSYQLDHAISLELGGAPYSTRNLWMQPIVQAKIDDQHENHWNDLVCAGTLTLAQGQQAELSWKRANG